MKTNNLSPNESSSQKVITVILEFSVLKPKPMLYRGVQTADGGFRMEKRGPTAKKFKPFMWSGSIESIYWQQELLLRKLRTSAA